MNTSLNASRRLADIEAAAKDVVDVLVIGGGVTGAGVALDAASRGLSVVLAEAHDLAFGTSRWSSKLIHGGLRYLANGDVAIAYESAVERGIVMTRTAPHLTRPLPQLIPLYEGVSSALAMTGLYAGDLLRRIVRTPSGLLPRPRRIPAAEALALAPGLKREGLRGGLLSYDGQLIDDARFVIALARTAAGHGARILTKVKAVSLEGDGARLRDTLTGAEFDVRARKVINATGVWAGQLVESVRLRPSRGTHVVLSCTGITGTSLTVPIPGSRNRFVLVLPQVDGRIYVGLTDEPVDGEIPDVPHAPESDVDFLLSVASSVLERPLTRDDVLGAYAGLRPLLDADGASADLSRRHAVRTAANGVITVVGGKFTTYRRMAADAVDATGLTTIPARTKDIPLVGATARERLGRIDAPARLIAKYGTEAAQVAKLDPARLHPDLTIAEVIWAFQHEGALDADDVLHRRSRVGLVPAEANPLVDIVSGYARSNPRNHSRGS
ncbi:glycerol-3-phosphate dehydrogenase/oxidase [Kibdelosporangium philippinense]|uniref:Glycerol-3-phosphate dehydrogenase n=1 Tax=Kibdelosporangium philippinense TaxID=211113 RepID=A0ABS8ZMJ7_9PSEU|nr:glycerol-3-phosphate dehydrogenase/oxidase [Kibdelosporangium philippinense]MCE7008974.1 glycerol-3-phosphate dehydrogenase/oxidase [Kibdelosporangium philippinense]